MRTRGKSSRRLGRPENLVESPPAVVVDQRRRSLPLDEDGPFLSTEERLMPQLGAIRLTLAFESDPRLHGPGPGGDVEDP